MHSELLLYLCIIYACVTQINKTNIYLSYIIWKEFPLQHWDEMISSIKICHPSKNSIAHTQNWHTDGNQQTSYEQQQRKAISYEQQQRKEIQATGTTTIATNTQLRRTGKRQQIPKGRRNHIKTGWCCILLFSLFPRTL